MPATPATSACAKARRGVLAPVRHRMPRLLAVMPADRSWKTRPNGRPAADRITVRDRALVHGGATYLVILRRSRIRRSRLNVVPASLANDAMRAAWMADKGCEAQAEALLRSRKMIQHRSAGSRGSSRDHALGWLLVPLGVAALHARCSRCLRSTGSAFLDQRRPFVQDWEIALQPYGEPQDPDIVIVAINEDTLRNFPIARRSTAGSWPTLLQSLAPNARAPSASTSCSTSRPNRHKDEALRETLHALKVPLRRRLYRSRQRRHRRSARLSRTTSCRRSARALVNIATDQFDTVRWVYPGETPSTAAMYELRARAGAKRRRQDRRGAGADRLACAVPSSQRYRRSRNIPRTRCNSFRRLGSRTRSS